MELIISILILIILINKINSDISFLIDLLKFTNSTKYIDCIKNVVEPLLSLESWKTYKYHWFFDYSGKIENDLGNELECLKTIGATYFQIEINVKEHQREEENELTHFLELNKFDFGFCFPLLCKNYIRDLVSINESYYGKGIYSNVFNITVDKISYLESYSPNDKNSNNIIIEIFQYIFVILICIKLLIGIFRFFCFPKGYEKHGVLLYLKNKGESVYNLIDNKSNKVKNEINTALIQVNEEYELNDNDPLTFESYIPWHIKIIRFFDLFSNIYLFFSNRNRYFNDNGLELLIFMRFLVLYFYIFVNTINSITKLPVKDILNTRFFNSYWFIFYKLSTQAVTCWIILEGAYTFFKLLKYIKADLYKYYKEHPSYNMDIVYCGKIAKTIIKFQLLQIPKIIMFFLSFLIFYKFKEFFQFLFKFSTTFQYFAKNILEQKSCYNQNSTYFSLFSLVGRLFSISFDIGEYECSEFTFIYGNMLFSYLFVTIIIFFSFLFKSTIFDVIMIIINIISFFVTASFQKHQNKEYLFYDVKGAIFSIKYFFLFVNFYYFGYILGLLYFHYDNINKKPIIEREYNLILSKENPKSRISSKDEISTLNDNSSKKSEKSEEEKNNVISDKKISITNINEDSKLDAGETQKILNINEFDLPFYPLVFFKNFLLILESLSLAKKYCIIFICIFLILLLSSFHNIFIGKNGYKFDHNWISILMFKYEKHFFTLFFFIINITVMTLPKTGFIYDAMKFKLFTAVTRVGFLIICLGENMVYIIFCLFLFKMKLYFPTIILFAIGNFLLIFVISILFNILFELPIRIIIKKIARMC